MGNRRRGGESTSMSNTRNIFESNKPTVKKTVAVVGGGIAGLYAALKLRKDYNVTVFEATDRLGGRILSQSIRDVVAELGAMRFRKNHLLLMDLLEELKLTSYVRSFAFDDRFYLRGYHATSLSALPFKNGNQLEEKDQLSNQYNLYKTERKDLHSPGDLIKLAFKKIFSKEDKFQPHFEKFLRVTKRDNLDSKEKVKALEEFRKAYESCFKYEYLIGEVQGASDEGRRDEGRRTHLYNIGFWNLIALMLSNDAFHLAQDGIGYESIFTNWNAAEAIFWFVSDYIDNDYWTLRGGLSTVITTLKRKLEEDGVCVRYDHILSDVKIEHRSLPPITAPVILRFKNGAAYQCDRVVLALPRRSLEELQVSGSSGWQAFRQVSGSVIGQRAFKCFLVYENEWWLRDSPFGDGKKEEATDKRKKGREPTDLCYRICTDLPLRQIYYFGLGWLSKHLKESNDAEAGGKALVMASYSDDRHATFWRPLFNARYEIDSEEQEPYNTREQFSTEDFRRLKPFLASKRMVNYIVAQLLKLHDCLDDDGNPTKKKDVAKIIREPKYALYKMWDPESGEAGWHYWEVRWKRKEVEEKLHQLAEYDGICICGEAYSDNQGWIEGALHSTETILSTVGLIQAPARETRARSRGRYDRNTTRGNKK